MKSDGEIVVGFIEEFLTLNGSFAGQPFIPLPWMKEVIGDIFKLKPDGTRQHRTYLLGLPRKNAKSTLGAALAVYMLIADGADHEPVVVSAAGDRKQAKLVFNMAKNMILASPALLDICTVQRDIIKCNTNGGTYQAVSSDAGLSHGLNPTFVVVDEAHVHKSDELYVALNSGSATRNQPLTLVISTAGFDEHDSFLGGLYTYSRRVKSGESIDPTFGSTWFGPPDGEFDHTDPEVWESCNPSWQFMNPEEMESACRQMPESEFVRYRLNGWTAAQNAWLPAGAWDSCYKPDTALEPGDLIVLGFDGAWKGDSTALVSVRLSDMFVTVLGHWEAPPNDIHWRTPAEEVEDCIRQACITYSVREVAADPFRFEQSLLSLAEEGIPIVEFPTNSLTRIIPATQTCYDAVLDKTLSHDNNAALARHVDNASVKSDARGARITKDNRASSKHIDLAIALIIALHSAALWREDTTPEPQLIIL